MEVEVSKEEFLEKYGNVEVVFSFYYKYSFVFEATLAHGKTLYVSVGGDGDDIYRLEVDNKPITVRALNPRAGSATDADGNTMTLQDEGY